MTISNIHFISGLPRSGSTLLSAILRQNPRFATGVTSPLAAMCGVVLEKMSGGGEFAAFFDEERRRAMLRGLFDSYYAAAGQVVFDTNRSWTGQAALLAALYPQARIVCCVRDIGWIIDSVERMVRKNPTQLSRVFGFKPTNSVYGRVEVLMNSESGLVGLAWSTLREAWFGDHASRLILVQYDSLVSHPEAVIGRLYRELGEKPFPHDFDRLAHDEPDYDAILGMPGLHLVRPKVEKQERPSIIPPDLFAKYADLAFWARPELNHRGATVL